MYKLLIEDDEGGKTAVSLIRDEITIGRKEGNTIRLTERNVSRRHGRILRDGERIFIEDVAARYGIKKNGKKIEGRTEVKEGDVFLIGDYRLTLQPDPKGKKSPPKPKVRAPGRANPREVTQVTSTNGVDGMRREDTQVMAAMPAKLVVISSNFASQEFPLDQQELVIGRGPECNIRIDHRSISSRHAKIVREDPTTYKIVDLNSKNGVRVSGDTYRATLLKRGDVIELGHVKFRFVEPGENYVFTPGASVPVAGPVGVSGGPNKMLVGGGVLLVVAVLVALGLVFTGGGGETGEVDAAPVNNEEVAAATEEFEESEVDSGEDRIEAGIVSAREQIAEGRLQRAIGTLELLQSFAPSADQAAELLELMTTARNELPFQRSYEDTLEALDRGDHLEAIKSAASVPSHSIFASRMEEEGVLEEIFGAMLDMGHDALDDGEYDEAAEYAEEVLVVRSGHARAEELLSAIEVRKQEAAQAEQERQEAARAARTEQGSRPAVPRSTSSVPRVSAEEARELFVSAARKLRSSNFGGAIEDCTVALRAGHTPCHRILGLAHSRRGETAQACSHFGRYLGTGPENPEIIQQQVEELGCP